MLDLLDTATHHFLQGSIGHITVGYPDDTESESLQHLGPLGIHRRTASRLVDCAVHFDDEPELCRVEVNDEPPDPVLPPELCTETSPAPQQFPYDLFCRGALPPEVASGLDLRSASEATLHWQKLRGMQECRGSQVTR